MLHFHENSLSAQFMQVQAETDKLVNINVVGMAETTEISWVGVVHLFGKRQTWILFIIAGWANFFIAYFEEYARTQEANRDWVVYDRNVNSRIAFGSFDSSEDDAELFQELNRQVTKYVQYKH